MDSESNDKDITDLYIYYSIDYINCKWPFGKPFHVTLSNYKDLVDSLPPNSRVFPICDGIETDG